MDPNKAFVLKSPSDVLIDSHHTYTLQPLWHRKSAWSPDSCRNIALEQKNEGVSTTGDFVVSTFLQEYKHRQESSTVAPRFAASYSQASSNMFKKRRLFASSDKASAVDTVTSKAEATPASGSFQPFVSTPSPGRVRGDCRLSPPAVKPRRFQRGSGPMHATMNCDELSPSVLFPLF